MDQADRLALYALADVLAAEEASEQGFTWDRLEEALSKAMGLNEAQTAKIMQDVKKAMCR